MSENWLQVGMQPYTMTRLVSMILLHKRLPRTGKDSFYICFRYLKEMAGYLKAIVKGIPTLLILFCSLKLRIVYSIPRAWDTLTRPYTIEHWRS